MDVVTTLDLPATPAPSSSERSTSIHVESRSALSRAWHPRAATLELERRRTDGRLVMSVEHDPDVGYLVYAPHNGRHLVANDGSRIRSVLPRAAPWRWQRLVVAQVLPLAATLQGLELLHASAVEWRGRALGFVARAGTGKTSVAAHMVASGGGLLTDDVLAVERTERGVAAHPGVATISIDSAELDGMSPLERARLGRCVGRADKLVLTADVVDHPPPLASLYFLERPSSGALTIERVEPDPIRILAHSFNLYVRTPERIVNQLETAAQLAGTVGLFSVRIPIGSGARDVAAAIVEHAERA
jgi:hypothetical protein